MNLRIWICITVFMLLCCKNENVEDNGLSTESKILSRDTDTSIFITSDNIINDKVTIRDSIFNYDSYENFIKSMVNSNRFVFVPLDEFSQTFSSEKVVVGLRHDIDYDIASSIRFARREYRNGVRATYYFLNTADYYCDIAKNPVVRKPAVLDYMRKIQDEYKHEVGWHNDLVTFQVVYNIDVKTYLSRELEFLRNKGIRIVGSSYHGSEYCYLYHYLYFYIWNYRIERKVYGPQGPPFENYDSVLVDGIYKKINKFEFSDFGFKYEAGLLNNNYFFADAFFYNNKRWSMAMFDWDSLRPGDRVIILTHPALWD